jgi:hypothetical protein
MFFDALSAWLQGLSEAAIPAGDAEQDRPQRRARYRADHVHWMVSHWRVKSLSCRSWRALLMARRMGGALANRGNPLTQWGIPQRTG